MDNRVESKIVEVDALRGLELRPQPGLGEQQVRSGLRGTDVAMNRRAGRFHVAPLDRSGYRIGRQFPGELCRVAWELK